MLLDLLSLTQEQASAATTCVPQAGQHRPCTAEAWPKAGQLWTACNRHRMLTNAAQVSPEQRHQDYEEAASILALHLGGQPCLSGSDIGPGLSMDFIHPGAALWWQLEGV
jgi:hypothetical protein